MNPAVREVELAEVCSKIGVGLAMAVTPYMAATGVKLIRNQNIRPNRFDDSSVVYLDPSFAASQAAKAIRHGDVVIVRTGANIGDACVVPEDFDGSQSFTTLVARPNTKCLSARYLAQYINSSLGRFEVERLMAGGGKGNLNSGELERFRIKLLPVGEQEQIARLLIVWDMAAELITRLIAAKERHYTHELSRLIGRDHHPRSHVAAFAHEVTERNRSGNGARVLSVTNARGLLLPEDQFERRVASVDLSNYKVVTRGQYAYNPSRINVGSIARLDGWDMGALSPMYVVFALDEAKVNSDYFLHWLDSHEASERISKSAQGSVRETVSFSEFAAISIPLPDVDKQAAIARYLNALQKEISTLRAYAEKLRVQKRGLMQRLLTGKWRVKLPRTKAA
jgi:type I restriction enzyme S subunit